MSNADLNKTLEDLPEVVARALEEWRIKTLDREKTEALLYLQYKGGGEKRTSDEIKAMVRADGGRYQAVLEEAKAESYYTFVYEKLLASKRQANLRTAY